MSMENASHVAPPATLKLVTSVFHATADAAPVSLIVMAILLPDPTLRFTRLLPATKMFMLGVSSLGLISMTNVSVDVLVGNGFVPQVALGQRVRPVWFTVSLTKV